MGDRMIGKMTRPTLSSHHPERRKQPPRHPSPRIEIIAPKRPVCAPWPRWENQSSPLHFVQMALLSTLAAHTPAWSRSSALATVRENRVAIAVGLESLIGIGPGYLAPRASNIVTHVIAAAANGRTENDVNIVGPCTKGSGHDRECRANNVRDGSPPPRVDNADGRATTPSTGIDDQHRLTVGMQGHQHGADLVRHERIAEPDLRRWPPGAQLAPCPACALVATWTSRP